VLKKLLIGLALLFSIGVKTGIAQTNPVRVDCQNFASGVYQMAKYAAQHPKLASPEALLNSVGLTKEKLAEFPKEVKELAVLATGMILSELGRQYQPEDHGHGALSLCAQSEGDVEKINEFLRDVLKQKKV